MPDGSIGDVGLISALFPDAEMEIHNFLIMHLSPLAPAFWLERKPVAESIAIATIWRDRLVPLTGRSDHATPASGEYLHSSSSFFFLLPDSRSSSAYVVPS